MKKMRKHFRGVRIKKVIKTESVWMSKGALFMAATLESKRKPNSFGEKKMQNIYTLIKKREVKCEWYKH